MPVRAHYFDVRRRPFPSFRPNSATRTLVLAMATLLAATTLTGCGTTPNNTFSGSPSGGGTPVTDGNSGSGGSNAITASSVKSVTVPSTSIASGAASPAAVTLNAPAPAGGASIALTSSNTSAASVPANVTVGAGQTNAGFVVTASSVSSDTSVSIAAAYNNTFAGVMVSVKAPAAPPPSSGIAVSISPASASLLAGASQQFTATVTGSSNTAVSWTATGGTITTTGLFTAPSVSTSTMVTVYATSQADPSALKAAQVAVTPATMPPPSGSAYEGTGPVASWKAYQYRDTDSLYHQAIKIYNAQGAYPVIGYSYSSSDCTNLGDTFNDFWQPLGNGLWWFIHRPELVYVKWVWYNNSTDRQILQQTPCLDYSGAPQYN